MWQLTSGLHTCGRTTGNGLQDSTATNKGFLGHTLDLSSNHLSGTNLLHERDLNCASSSVRLALLPMAGFVAT